MHGLKVGARQRSRRRFQRVFLRTQHEGERRPELVADVREERGLGAIDLGERLGALLLLRQGP